LQQQVSAATKDYLDDLTESESSLDYSLEKYGMMSNGEKQMRAFVHKKQFKHSLFTHPPGDSTRSNRSLAVVTYKIAGAHRSLKASVALAQ